MDFEVIKAIVESVGEENILALNFDNSRVEYFEKGEFKLSDFEVFEGYTIYKRHMKGLSKGAKGGKLDIPITAYNGELQSILVLDNAEDRERLDFAEFVVR